MAKTSTQAALHTLSTANGSATYTSANKTHIIIAGVNYPVEVPYRSDELPESTLIEVNVRPHNGVSQVKERHVELLVQKTLQAVVLVEQTPRTMLQVTLQVMSVAADESLPGGIKDGGQGESYLDLLVGCVNTAILGCLDAAVQMKDVVGAALVGIGRDGSSIANPTVSQRKSCRSLHAFAFTRGGEVVLMESEGTFDMEEWESTQRFARVLVLGDTTTRNGDIEMNGVESVGDSSCFMNTLRTALEVKTIHYQRWKEP